MGCALCSFTAAVLGLSNGAAPLNQSTSILVTSTCQGSARTFNFTFSLLCSGDYAGAANLTDSHEFAVPLDPATGVDTCAPVSYTFEYPATSVATFVSCTFSATNALLLPSQYDPEDQALVFQTGPDLGGAPFSLVTQPVTYAEESATPSQTAGWTMEASHNDTHTSRSTAGGGHRGSSSKPHSPVHLSHACCLLSCSCVFVCVCVCSWYLDPSANVATPSESFSVPSYPAGVFFSRASVGSNNTLIDFEFSHSVRSAHDDAHSHIGAETRRTKRAQSRKSEPRLEPPQLHDRQKDKQSRHLTRVWLYVC